MHYIEQTWREVNHSKHPYHQPMQWLIRTEVSYLGTLFFTSLSPREGLFFTAILIAVDDYSDRFFVRLLEHHGQQTLVPLVYHLMRFTVSILLARAVSAVFRLSISNQQGWILGGLYLSGFYVTKILYHRMNPSSAVQLPKWST